METLVRPSGGGFELMDRWWLRFLDGAVEGAFRAAERDRNLGQARFALTLAILINLAFAVTDPWMFPDQAWTLAGIRLFGMTMLMLLLIGCSLFFDRDYSRFFHCFLPFQKDLKRVQTKAALRCRLDFQTAP